MQEIVLLTVMLLKIKSLELLLQNISSTNLVTKGDILSKIWAPLFKKVFFVRGNLVRTKFGESISQYYQAEKKLQYANIKNIKAFKIDIRFLYDSRGNEHDVGADEVARKNIDEANILHDKPKLLRKGVSNIKIVPRIR